MSLRLRTMLLAGLLAALIRLAIGLTIGPPLTLTDLVTVAMGGAWLGFVGYHWLPWSRS
jgi:hypothetical protein